MVVTGAADHPRPPTTHLADVAALRAIGGHPAAVPPDAGLRERKKQHTRQLLTDTATALFLQRGFDEVTVAEVARACGVSQKTVYNYFPTKESLLLDEEDALADAIHAAASAVDTPPVHAVLGLLDARLHQITDSLGEHGDDAAGIDMITRFTDLIEHTPSLRAHHRDTTDRLVTVAAEGLAGTTGLPPTDPEIQASAHALIALCRIQEHAIRHHAATTTTLQRLAELVTTDVHRAAHLTQHGLQDLPPRRGPDHPR